jgi:Domain of unknown function (DUF1707)
VAISPWDPTSSFLASDADRDRVVDRLRTAFVRGALTSDELTVRTGRALAARTYGDLTAVTAGLTASEMTKQTQPAPRTKVSKKFVAWSAGALVMSAGLGISFLTFYGGFLVMMLLAFAGAVLCSKPPAAVKAPLAKSMGGKH